MLITLTGVAANVTITSFRVNPYNSLEENMKGAESQCLFARTKTVWILPNAEGRFFPVVKIFR